MSHASSTPAAYPVDTGMVWGFRRSFLGYVRSILDGSIAIGEGLGLTTNYDFYFPLADTAGFDPNTGTGTLRFSGRLQLSGHGGAISLDLAEPWVRLTGEGGSMSLLLTHRDRTRVRAPLFELGATAPDDRSGILEWQGVRPVLTDAGVELFESNYPPRAEFDPLSIRIPSATAE